MAILSKKTLAQVNTIKSDGSNFIMNNNNSNFESDESFSGNVGFRELTLLKVTEGVTNSGKDRLSFLFSIAGGSLANVDFYGLQDGSIHEISLDQLLSLIASCGMDTDDDGNFVFGGKSYDSAEALSEAIKNVKFAYKPKAQGLVYASGKGQDGRYFYQVESGSIQPLGWNISNNSLNYYTSYYTKQSKLESWAWLIEDGVDISSLLNLTADTLNGGEAQTSKPDQSSENTGKLVRNEDTDLPEISDIDEEDVPF